MQEKKQCPRGHAVTEQLLLVSARKKIPPRSSDGDCSKAYHMYMRILFKLHWHPDFMSASRDVPQFVFLSMITHWYVVWIPFSGVSNEKLWYSKKENLKQYLDIVISKLERSKALQVYREDIKTLKAFLLKTTSFYCYCPKKA